MGLVFYVDHGGQASIRARTDFFLANLPTFDAHAGVARPNLLLDNRLAELTTFFTVFSFNLPLAELRFARSWDDALARATKDFVLIQNAGHIFYGGDALSEAFRDALDACAFATGHIMDRGGYFYLHDQCVLINRRAWDSLGRPPVGAPVKARQEVALPERSAENVHDGYTPLWLKPTGRSLPLEASFGYGWELISRGLAGGHTVNNWSNRLRSFKRHCYAYYGDGEEWRRALDDAAAAGPTEDKQLADMLSFLRNTPSAMDAPDWVFVFNSEADTDIPLLRYRNGLDRAFLLASGFKGNRILETLGFGAHTEVVIYDYSRPSLLLREAMVREWDGRDFAAFFATARPRIDAACGDMKPRYIPEGPTGDSAAVAREFTREIAGAFPSMDAWLAHWDRYRRLRHHFVAVDVLRAPDQVVAMIDRHAAGHCVMWLSDMFNSPNAVGKFGFARRKAPFDALLDRLAARADSHLVIGSEPRPWLPP
jgi:hypothetical protein